MLGWSMTIPAADGRAVWGAVGETGRKVLTPLAWALSLPLIWGEFDASRALVIFDGKSDGSEKNGAPGALGEITGREDLRPDGGVAGDAVKTEREGEGTDSDLPVFDWQWRGGARFFARSWDGPMALEIETARFPADPLPVKWLKFLFFAGLFPMRRSGLAVIHHGALIERGGRGILIAGPSGMGKSTLCRDIKADWNVLADDMVLCYRNGGQLCARPLPTWSLWSSPDKTPRPADPSREVPLALAVMLGRGAAAWRLLPNKETKFALSTSFSYFIPHWLLDPEIHFFRNGLVEGLVPVLDDFQRNLPGCYFCRTLKDAPSAYFDEMMESVGKKTES